MSNQYKQKYRTHNRKVTSPNSRLFNRALNNPGQEICFYAQLNLYIRQINVRPKLHKKVCLRKIAQEFLRRLFTLEKRRNIFTCKREFFLQQRDGSEADRAGVFLSEKARVQNEGHPFRSFIQLQHLIIQLSNEFTSQQ